MINEHNISPRAHKKYFNFDREKIIDYTYAAKTTLNYLTSAFKTISSKSDTGKLILNRSTKSRKSRDNKRANESSSYYKQSGKKRKSLEQLQSHSLIKNTNSYNSFKKIFQTRKALLGLDLSDPSYFLNRDLISNEFEISENYINSKEYILNSEFDKKFFSKGIRPQLSPNHKHKNKDKIFEYKFNSAYGNFNPENYIFRNERLDLRKKRPISKSNNQLAIY